MPFSSHATEDETTTIRCMNSGATAKINKSGATEGQLRLALAIQRSCFSSDIACHENCSLNNFIYENRDLIARLLQATQI